MTYLNIRFALKPKHIIVPVGCAARLSFDMEGHNKINRHKSRATIQFAVHTLKSTDVYVMPLDSLKTWQRVFLQRTMSSIQLKIGHGVFNDLETLRKLHIPINNVIDVQEMYRKWCRLSFLAKNNLREFFPKNFDEKMYLESKSCPIGLNNLLKTCNLPVNSFKKKNKKLIPNFIMYAAHDVDMLQPCFDFINNRIQILKCDINKKK